MANHRFLNASGVILASLIALPGSAIAAIFTVGTGAGCSHGTIQSALNAASASPGADTVRLTRSLTYQPEANTINDSGNLNLVGGFATCTQTATDSIKTVVSGAGGAAEPVLRVFAGTGVVIKLRHLTITQGDEDGNGAGGGIFFQGDGVLEIIESTISNSSAAYGGGIYALGTGTNAELIISEGTLISNNTARYSGGGISIGGPIEMSMTAPNSIIAFNDALGEAAGTGFGGGLLVNGRAIAYVSTNGVGGLGAIYSNTAIDGGGIAVISGAAGGADATVHLFTSNPSQPVTVQGNYALDTGGAVYLQSYQSFSAASSLGKLCASDFRIEFNAARDGSAIYQNSDDVISLGPHGSAVSINDPSCVRPGAVRCSSGIACNTISGNDAVEAGGGFSGGATLRVLGGSQLTAYRFEMRANRGGDAIRADGESGRVQVEDCLLAGNELSRYLVSVEDESFGNIVGCTLARNVLGARVAIRGDYYVQLLDSIVDQPGDNTMLFSGAQDDLRVRNLLSREIVSVPSDPSVIADDPMFVDPAAGNFRLRQTSPAVDFAAPVVGDDRDLDNQPRDQDISSVSNLFGVRDLGAYERQLGQPECEGIDAIFCSGFESP